MASRKSGHGNSIYHKRGTKVVHIPLVLFIALCVGVIGLTILLWSAERGRDTRLQVENPGDLAALMPSIVGLTGGSLEQGNKIELLENGDGFFPALLTAIAGAQESVHLESYIWWKGDICRKVAAALEGKARAGVEVRLLLDASGSSRMDDNLKDEMEKAGVRIAKFHPIRFANLGRLNNRDHRKICVVDGRIGFLGGHGIADEWTGHAQDRKHWRDTALRVEGPIVGRLQAAFSENWIEETGAITAGERYFKKLPPAGSVAAHVAYTSPTGGVSSVQVLYYMAIKAARKEIIIQNPYMLPDGDALDALGDAVKRGVKVMVMVPAVEVTDSAIVQHASHHHFGSLLKAGVRLFEYKKTLLHQKVIIVDGTWSCVGSTNFDDRSFQLNDEISMGVLDSGLASQLRAQYVNDLKSCQERHLEEWSHRGLWHKLEDGVAYLGAAQL